MPYSVHNILASRYSYYKNLSAPAKQKFLLRVNEFIENKDIEGRSGLEVTQTMQVLIAASAIQLTFGLDNYLLKHFGKIIIYPGKFYSRLSRSTNVGEVNTGGAIVLSWKAFEEGLSNQKDSYNVALHEMAHALNLTDLLGKDVDPVFSAYFDKWYVHARKLLKKLPTENTFFRKYASKNIQELFAVGVEHFFEQPEEFKATYPVFYQQFVYLLNQDPLQKDNGVISYPDRKIKKLEKENPVMFVKPAKKKVTMLIQVALPLLFAFIFIPMWGVGSYISWILGALLLYSSFSNFHRGVSITVYDDRFIVRYPMRLFNKEKVFLTEEMVSVNYLNEDKTSYISIVNYIKGSIEKEHFEVYTDFDSFRPLFKYLFNECSVAIKNNGEIVIPE